MTKTSAHANTDQVAAARRALIAQRLRGEGRHEQLIPRRPLAEPVPLTPAQHGLWVVDQMLRDNSLYGVYDAVRLRGPIDADAIRLAFTDLLARQEILRTVFVTQDGEPVQLVRPHEEAIEVLEVRQCPEPTGLPAATRWLEKELTRGFDLSTGPLLRATLLRLADDDHVLFVHLHHIIADEWSCGLLSREISELYQARVEQRASRLEPAEVQFADYAAWLRRQLTPDRLDAHLDFWRSALSGVDAQLRLPTDFARPQTQSHQGRAVLHRLDAELSERLREVAHQRGTTPFTLLLTVFAAFLGEHTGQTNFAIGSLAAGRNLPQLSNSLGLFASTIAIPFDLRGRPGFAELLERTRGHVLGALAHQDVAFEQVVAALKVARDPSRNPLFQVMFQYLDSTDGRWTLPGVRIDRVEPDTQSSKLDITLSAMDDDGGIELQLTYATELFSPDTAVVILTGVEQVARRIVADPRGRIEVSGVPSTAEPHARTIAGSHRPALEEQITQIWADALGHDDFGRRDNFFEIGGDSLLAIKIASIGKRRGLPLSPTTLLHYQTIVDLAAALGEALGEADKAATSSEPANFPLARLDKAALDRVLQRIDEDEIEDIFPLSPLQEGMLFTVLADPGERSYIQEHVYDLNGNLDVMALNRAWQSAVDRHPAMRSRFLWEGLPHPVQVVCRHQGVHVEIVEPDTDTGSSELLDLAGPPHRFFLQQTGESSFRFTWRTHHLLLDGWSRDQVMREVLDSYESARTGVPGPEPAPVVALHDWVAWRERERGRDDTGFWRELMRGFTAPTTLPFDAGPTDRHGSEVALRVVDDSLAKDLRDLARRARVTIGAIFHTAWAIALHRNGAGSDVVFGTIVNGRYGGLPGLDRVVGMVMNTLPLRVGIATDERMTDLMGRVGVAIAELQSHANSSLVDIKRCTELPSGVNLFDSIFQFEAGPSPDDWMFGDAQATAVPTPIEVGYPLAVGAFLDGNLTLQAQYHRDRLSRETANRLLADFVDALRATVAEPDQRVGDLISTTEGTGAAVVADVDTVARIEPVDYVPPRTPTEKALAEIWAQVLSRKKVGVHDNFFVLGGDSLLSVRIVALARPAGMRFTSRDVLRQQTIARLAEAISAQEKQASAVSPATTTAMAQFPLTGLSEKETSVLLRGFAPGEVEDAYRLSPLQLGMLFDRLASPGKDAYFRHYAWQLRGDLDVDTLIVAWQQVADRHPALRTCFRWEGLRHPVQVVVKRPELPVRHWDGRAVADHEREEWFAKLIADDLDRGVDVTKPSMRLAVIRVGDREHRLLWTVHHLLIDGWSQQVVFDELLTIYSALRQGVSPTLRPVVPFREHVEWVQRAKANNAGYWRGALSGYEPAASDHAAQAKQDAGWGNQTVLVPADLTLALQEAARRHRVTPFALLLGVWALTLAPPDNDDIVIGTVLSGRGCEVSGVERIVGLLLNTMPVRVRFAQDTLVSDWLREVQSTVAELQHLPPYSTAEIVRAADLPAGQRLFDAVFSLEAFGESIRPIADLEVAPLEGKPGQPYHPLVCRARLDSELTLELEYRTSHHDDAQASRMAEEYIRFLSAVAEAGPHSTIAEILASPQPPDGTAKRDTQATLAEIWRQLLNIDSVLPQDNYYQLGGDSFLAFYLVSEGRRAGLPITIEHISDYPVLADLAAALDQVSATAPTVELGAADTNQIPLTPAQHRFFAHAGNPHHHNQSRQLDLLIDLHEPMLERALHAVVAHHEGLRIRLVQDGRQWHQHITEREESTLVTLVDLSSIHPSLWDARVCEITDQLHRGLHLGQGPLLRAALIRAPRGLPDRLAIAIHHVAVDTVSWQIILDDLRVAYDGFASGNVVALPATSAPLRQWARHLVECAGSSTIADELAHWGSVPPVPRLPRDRDGANTEKSLRCVDTVLPAGHTTALVQGAQQTFGTSLHVLLLTALARTLSGWAGGDTALVDVEGHGREALHGTIDLSRTVGWFTSIHPLALRLPEDSDISTGVAAVNRVVAATPKHGVGYGIARYLRQDGIPRDKWPDAEVLFNYQSRQSDKRIGDTWYRFADDLSTARDPSAERSHLIEIDASVEGRQLRIAWNYSTNVHHDETVRAIADQFLAHLGELADACAPSAGGSTTGNPIAGKKLTHGFQRRLVRGNPALATIQKRHHIPGISVAVLAGGDIADAWGAGVTTTGGDPVSTATAFQACSISKHVTTFGVLRLVAAGMLDLDEDIRSRLKGWTLDRTVTLRGLLSHTAGLTVFGHPGYDRLGTLPTLEQILMGQGPAVTPAIVVEHDQAFAYSCSNFSVIQKLLVDVTGKEFADLLRQLVLAPIGMVDSGFEADFALRHDVAYGHRAGGVPVEGGWRAFPEQAASGLWTTPTDLCLLAQAIRASVTGSGLLPPDLARAMLERPDGSLYGLGSLVREHDGEVWYGHPGDRDSFQCVTLTGLRGGDGLVVMANGGGNNSAFLTELLAEIGFPFPPALT